MDPIHHLRRFFRECFIVLFVSFTKDINSHERCLKSSFHPIECGWLREKKRWINITLSFPTYANLHHAYSTEFYSLRRDAHHGRRWE